MNDKIRNFISFPVNDKCIHFYLSLSACVKEGFHGLADGGGVCAVAIA